MTALRTLVVVLPDWPVVAAGAGPADRAVVVAANRVVAASVAARQAGVRVGSRRREAQARCPHLEVFAADSARDAREFEPILVALAELCPRLEVLSPGCCAFPTRGPSRYFGGDERLAVRVKETVEEVVGDRARVRVGVADGRFTAQVAANPAFGEGADGGVVVVPAEESGRWLADLPVSILAAVEPALSEGLADLFRRLGLVTLGMVAGLPAGQVLSRFGPEGMTAHRLAAGRDERPALLADPPSDMAVEMVFDPPAERAETAGFAARTLADELGGRLSARGVSCSLLLVVAETEHGERSERRWRLGPQMGDVAVAERVRWQLEGWLDGPAAARPTAGVTLLRLVPEEIMPAGGSQLSLWGQPSAAPERVVRAVARLEGLLGPGAVTMAKWRGGRHPAEQAPQVPASTVDPTGRKTPIPVARGVGREVPVWPGGLPSPSPTVVLTRDRRRPVEVLDDRGQPVGVDGRSVPGSGPAVVVIDGARRQVTGWGGPWPVVERWWDPQRRCRQARFQLLTDDGLALLVVLEAGRWLLAGIYD